MERNEGLQTLWNLELARLDDPNLLIFTGTPPTRSALVRLPSEL